MGSEVGGSGAGSSGAAALAGLDRVLAGKPAADGHMLSEVTQQLCLFRDELIAGGRRTHLSHVNSVLSVVLAAHYPLEGVPWDEVERARAWLADAVAA